MVLVLRSERGERNDPRHGGVISHRPWKRYGIVPFLCEALVSVASGDGKMDGGKENFPLLVRYQASFFVVLFPRGTVLRG